MMDGKTLYPAPSTASSIIFFIGASAGKEGDTQQ
jgi:hypothetical protein